MTAKKLIALQLAAVLVAVILLVPPSYAAITDTLTSAGDTVRIGLPPTTQTVVVQITGTFVATVVTEASIDGSTWFTLPMFAVDTGTAVTSVTAPGRWVVSAAAYGNVRARASAYTSGTATVHLETSAGASFAYVFTAGGAGTQNVNLQQIGGTAQSGADVIDVANTAIRVNVVAGGAGGGVAQIQVRNSGDTAWVNVGVGAEGAAVLKVPVRIHDASGNIVAVLNAAPAGTEYALVVRNIPSGTQTVSGTVTANQGGSWTVTANQGTANTAANRWPVYVTDGTQNMPMMDAAARKGFVQVSDGTDNAQVTATSGGSLQVECAAGCGTPTQAQTYNAVVVSAAAAASKDYLTVFNATGSGKILKIIRIDVSRAGTAAVVGVSANFTYSRVSTSGTTCTAVTINPLDSTNAAVPAQVTANTTCTTDPTVTFDIGGCSAQPEETATGKADDNCYTFLNSGGQPITLREGQGIMLKTTALAPVGLVTVRIELTM